jgi:hypothetical protein
VNPPVRSQRMRLSFKLRGVHCVQMPSTGWHPSVCHTRQLSRLPVHTLATTQSVLDVCSTRANGMIRYGRSFLWTIDCNLEPHAQGEQIEVVEQRRTVRIKHPHPFLFNVESQSARLEDPCAYFCTTRTPALICPKASSDHAGLPYIYVRSSMVGRL